MSARKAKELPSGPAWIYEIKHDGFRILAQRKDAARVRLITRNGYDFADRYPLIVNAINRLPVETCIIDGEAIVVDQNGLSVFDLLRYRRHDHATTLCAFDVLEVETEPTCGGSQSRSASSISLGHYGHRTTASRSMAATVVPAKMATPIRVHHRSLHPRCPHEFKLLESEQVKHRRLF